MPDIVVHHLERSRSQRVLWLLEELGVPYRIERYVRHPKTLRAPPELRSIHPLGRSPVVVVDGVVLAESGAILEELAARFGDGSLVPTDPDAARRMRFWLHYAEGSLMPPLLVALVLSQIRKAPWPVRPIARGIASTVHRRFSGPEIASHLAFIEASLADGPWFAGAELSLADVQMCFPVEAALTRGSAGDLPRTRAWLERVHGRPAWGRALEKGGPYGILG